MGGTVLFFMTKTVGHGIRGGGAVLGVLQYIYISYT